MPSTPVDESAVIPHARWRRVYDTFVVYLDNETRAGEVHPPQALLRYRQRVDPTARLPGVAGSRCGNTQ